MSRKQFGARDGNAREVLVTWAGTSNIAFTDTVTHDSDIMDVSKIAGKKALMVINSINQTVTITILVRTADSNNGTITVSKTLPAGTWGVFTGADFPVLDYPFQRMSFRVQCSTAPTSGNIGMYLEGINN